MKKSIISKILVLTLCLSMALVVPAISLAAERGEPTPMTVNNDGKAHKVCVFGTSLALVGTDGSVDISPIGKLAGVDIMLDGVVYKNVSTMDAPAGLVKKMVLDKGSVLVKNVTPESGEAIKQQISEAYAAGATTVNIADLGNVTAYKVNEDGKMENASGTVVDAKTTGLGSSVSEAYADFSEEMETIIQEQWEEEAQEAGAVFTLEAEESSEEPVSSSTESVSGNSVD